MFNISIEKVCMVIQLSRQLDVKDPPADDRPGSTPSDDLEADALEFRSSDTIGDELETFIDELNDDEALDLVTLMWVGRGTYTSEDWEEARSIAAAERVHKTSEYLMGTPLLPDYLEEAISQFGESCEGQALDHL